MQPVIIGIVSGIIVILSIFLLKRFDKLTVYAFILVGIGYLYVGYNWTDPVSLVVSSIQALGFMLLAYYGMKNTYLLALGFFLHGCWDLVYDVLPLPDLLPPHYDLFCLSIDWVIGLYLARLAYGKTLRTNLSFIL